MGKDVTPAWLAALGWVAFAVMVLAAVGMAVT
jgi:hypothetical protein